MANPKNFHGSIGNNAVSLGSLDTTTSPSIRECVTSWHQALESWARSGKLETAITEAFGPDLDQDLLKKIVTSLGSGSFHHLPVVKVLPSRFLQGHWTAFSAARNTIYVDPDLRSFPTLATYALSHELGHWLAQQLLEKEPHHETIAHLANILVPAEPDIVGDASHDDFGHSDVEEEKFGRITLPSGEKVDVRWFDTSIHNNWDNEIFPFLSANAKSLLEQGQNDTDALVGAYGNQFVSASHFDNSNIGGGVDLVRGRYQSGLASFMSTSIAEKSNSLTTQYWYANPAFNGADAGIQHLLYRFGQILHAWQDFYSHSNWVELAKKGRLGSSALLDDGLDFPRSIRPGEFLPGSNVMVATAGPDWSGILQKSGTGSYSGTNYDVYWNVDSNNPDSGGGEVWATTLNGTRVYGLATGATSGAVYLDPDQSVFLRDPSKTSFYQKEYFRGFDHGGVLAGTIYGQWVGPLNKDSASNANHLNAKKYANLQIQNEWDRLGNLIYKSYGLSGLEKFAKYAIANASDQEQYVRSFSQSGSRYFPAASSLNLQGPSLLASTSNAGVGQRDGVTVSQSLSLDEAVDGLTMSEAQGFRVVQVFDQGVKDGQGIVLTPSFVFQIQYYDSTSGIWVDSNHNHLDIHHQLGDDELALLRTPSEAQHLGSGKRAVWRYQRDSDLGGLATNHYVENLNLDARVVVRDFDLRCDRIVLVDSFTGEEVTFEESYYTPERTAEFIALLDEAYNISLNINPFADRSIGHYVFTKEQLANARQVPGSLALEASTFFDDYDGIDSATLSFVDYDGSLPFLEMVDGKLVVNSEIDAFRGTSALIKVAISDGTSIVNDQYLAIAVTPKISIDGHGSFDPGIGFVIDYDDDSRKGYHIYARLDDDSRATPSEYFQISTRIGESSGVPKSYSINNQDLKIARPWSSGRVNFYLAGAGSSSLRQLDVRREGTAYTLYDRQQRIATLQASSSESEAPEFQSVFDPSSPYQWLGLRLNSGDSLEVAYESDLIAAHSSDLTVSIKAEIYRESRLSGEIGLCLVDQITGDVIDPVTGNRVDQSLSDHSWDRYAVWKGSVPDGHHSDLNIDFSVDSSIPLDQSLLVPYAKVSAKAKDSLPRYYFSEDSLNAGGQKRIVPLASGVIGFEVHAGRGRFDYDDYILEISSLDVF